LIQRVWLYLAMLVILGSEGSIASTILGWFGRRSAGPRTAPT
jgi:hypothetical protein